MRCFDVYTKNRIHASVLLCSVSSWCLANLTQKSHPKSLCVTTTSPTQVRKKPLLDVSVNSIKRKEPVTTQQVGPGPTLLNSKG